MKPPAQARAVRRRIALFVIVSLVVVMARPATAHLKAASMLMRFADPTDEGMLATFGTHPIEESETVLEAPSGPIRARIYAPKGHGSGPGATGWPGVVIVHGVHRLGIDEPRLLRFSRSVAASGLTVLTPEVRELADYRIDPASITTIGEAAQGLRERLGTESVGLMGMSFAGGLSLLTAADPGYADAIGMVVAVGAHHDLGRVSRFFATNQVELPDGSVEARKAHDYGPLVLVYGHIEGFFPKEEADPAREALRFFLWEQPDRAREAAKALSLGSRARMDALLDRKIDTIAADLMTEIAGRGAEMDRVSPKGHLAGIKARVFLLHGAGDSVIPPSETLWLAKEVPPSALENALVSRAVGHVELDGAPRFIEKLELVGFMTRVLEAAGADAKPLGL